ncbi:MAG: FAD:protein FMN transferase [Fimbriimonas sp.]
MGCLFLPSQSAPISAELKKFTYTEYHMGVDARIVLFAPDQATAEAAATAAFARIGELDFIMSDYKPDSELMRLCDNSSGAPVRVSEDLFRVLERSQKVARESNGAFDITVGPLIKLWRKARKTGVLPSDTELKLAKSLVDYRLLKLDRAKRTAQLLRAGMRLDLGGIAKGDACDQAQRALRRFGVTCALVEMGGDIVVSEPPPGTDGWTIRVPNAGSESAPADLQFRNTAISSSGDTVQFVVIGGKQYSHVVDPRNGQALTNHVQVTLVAPDGLTSDPLSTALTVLPEEGRAKLLRSYPETKSYLRVYEAPKGAAGR